MLVPPYARQLAMPDGPINVVHTRDHRDRERPVARANRDGGMVSLGTAHPYSLPVSPRSRAHRGGQCDADMGTRNLVEKRYQQCEMQGKAIRNMTHGNVEQQHRCNPG